MDLVDGFWTPTTGKSDRPKTKCVGEWIYGGGFCAEP